MEASEIMKKKGMRAARIPHHRNINRSLNMPRINWIVVNIYFFILFNENIYYKLNYIVKTILLTSAKDL